MSFKNLLYTKSFQEIFGVGRVVIVSPQSPSKEVEELEPIEANVSKLNQEQKEQAEILGLTTEQYASEILALSKKEPLALIDNDDELNSLVSKSSDAFYSGYKEDEFDMGDIVAALNYYDDFLLNWTNMGSEISRLAEYWNNVSWQKEMSEDIGDVSFMWGGGYRTLEWSSGNQLGLKQDMTKFADAETLNYLVNSVSDIIEAIVNGDDKNSATGKFKKLASYRGFNTANFNKILNAGKSAKITQFSLKSKQNMNSLYAQIGMIANEKANIEENKSLKISQKHLRKIVRKNILAEISKAKKKKR